MRRGFSPRPHAHSSNETEERARSKRRLVRNLERGGNFIAPTIFAAVSAARIARVRRLRTFVAAKTSSNGRVAMRASCTDATHTRRRLELTKPNRAIDAFSAGTGTIGVDVELRASRTRAVVVVTAKRFSVKQHVTEKSAASAPDKDRRLRNYSRRDVHDLRSGNRRSCSASSKSARARSSLASQYARTRSTQTSDWRALKAHRRTQMVLRLEPISRFELETYGLRNRCCSSSLHHSSCF